MAALTTVTIALMVFLYKSAPAKIKKAVEHFNKEVALVDRGMLQGLDANKYPSVLQDQVKIINDHFKSEQERIEQEMLFSSEASHELRTPLAGIKLQTQIAQRTQDSAQRDKALANIMTSIDRSTQLVQSLLLYSRLSPHRLKQELEEINVILLIESILKSLHKKAKVREIDLVLEQHNTAILPMRLHAEYIETLLKETIDKCLENKLSIGQLIVKVERADDALKIDIVNDTMRQYQEEKTIAQEILNGSSRLNDEICRRILLLHGATQTFLLGETGEFKKATITLPNTY